MTISKRGTVGSRYTDGVEAALCALMAGEEIGEENAV